MPNNTMAGGLGESSESKPPTKCCKTESKAIEDKLNKMLNEVTKTIAEKVTEHEEALDNLYSNCCKDMSDRLDNIDAKLSGQSAPVQDEILKKYIELFTQVEQKLNPEMPYSQTDQTEDEQPEEYKEEPFEETSKKPPGCIEVQLCKPGREWWEWWFRQQANKLRGAGFEFWFWFDAWWNKQWARPQGFFEWWFDHWDKWFQRQFRRPVGWWFHFYAWGAVWGEWQKERLRLWTEGQIDKILNHCCPKEKKPNILEVSTEDDTDKIVAERSSMMDIPDSPPDEERTV